MATQGNRRATVFARIASGTVSLEPDPGRAQGWTVYVDGVPQSYVDLGDPGYLGFEYVRRIAAVLRFSRAADVPLKVLHLGGGGLTLPRWVAATRPGSSQTVIELDPLLLAVVAKHLPWPDDIAARVGDAREFTDNAEPCSYDAIVADVFQGAAMPASVAGTTFASAAARLLRPGGMLAMNLTDVPPLSYSRIQAATLRSAFGDVALLAAPALLRGRKAGNVVLAAAAQVGELPVAKIAAALARDPDPAKVWHGADLTGFLGGARARLDG
ncbi:spermidine synthase [Actinoplanes sp. TFC3]|uniref:spermidine synthase n=1 Tax=Actinoplanes sp. TFC3 TaxID=1710355 RepID=UPI00082CC1E8|nr:fused MFS/spermidine synthase [Actinoplanes sp. TFC3]